ncbi:ATP-dependent sacrificial sulfur transferase LarE [Anaerovoracaceae bacterium 41-7]|uniref:ATP-dependent sacrificial sulfur transferase LarE n=1 Tax=Anaerovoracaceae TaxID=543314 RepID=UPI00203D1F19|nr:ATP-dependent sacrificial sulfur transferase LarE [Senimuribacter intestinalis]
MEYRNLEEFFKENRKVALAFSGGVDSAYLLYAAQRWEADVTAYFAKSQFQPQFELSDAKRLAAELSAKLRILECDILEDETVAANPENRCYYCKKHIFDRLLEAAKADGYDVIIDGTNASDDAGDRPGMRALSEMKVLSPLRLCGMTKKEVRDRSKAAGLFTWDKPSYACLATRVPTGEKITEEKLCRIEGAEAALMKLGFSDFRIRMFHDSARVQLPDAQMDQFVAVRESVTEALKPYFNIILLDMQPR